MRTERARAESNAATSAWSLLTSMPKGWTPWGRCWWRRASSFELRAMTYAVWPFVFVIILLLRSHCCRSTWFKWLYSDRLTSWLESYRGYPSLMRLRRSHVVEALPVRWLDLFSGSLIQILLLVTSPASVVQAVIGDMIIWWWSLMMLVNDAR